MDIKSYVLGFAFSETEWEMEQFVVLIKKDRPTWQAGKLNGIGGKIEDEELPLDAMIREFEEETGVKTTIDQWYNFGAMHFETDILGGGAVVHLYRMFDDIIFNCVTMESEEVIIVNPIEVFNLHTTVHNLPILLPLALNKDFKYTTLKSF